MLAVLFQVESSPAGMLRVGDRVRLTKEAEKTAGPAPSLENADEVGTVAEVRKEDVAVTFVDPMGDEVEYRVNSTSGKIDCFVNGKLECAGLTTCERDGATIIDDEGGTITPDEETARRVEELFKNKGKVYTPGQHTPYQAPQPTPF